MNILMPITLFATSAFFGSVSSLFEYCIGERCFTIPGSNETKNFAGAKSWCTERSSSLVVVSYNATQEALISVLKSAQPNEQPKSSMFIDLQRKSKGATWNLLNGNGYLGGIGEQNRDQYFYYSYLQYRPNSYYVFASKPNNLRNFICEYEATRCSNISTNSYNSKGECFVKYENESLSWFQARERCHINGADLATFNYDSGTINYPDGVPFNTSWLNTTLSYWVGIRYNDWSWKSSDGGNEAIYTWWSSGEPNNTNYECVCVDPEGIPTWSWTDCDCSMPSQFVCLKIVPTTPAPSTTTTIPPTSFSTTSFEKTTNSSSKNFMNNALAIGLGVGLGGGVFLILLIVIIVVAVTFTRKRRRKNNGVESRNEVANTRGANKNEMSNIKPAAPDGTETYARVVPTKQHPVNDSNSQSNIIYSTPEFAYEQISEPSSFDPADIRRGKAQSIFLEGSSDVYANRVSLS